MEAVLTVSVRLMSAIHTGELTLGLLINKGLTFRPFNLLVKVRKYSIRIRLKVRKVPYFNYEYFLLQLRDAIIRFRWLWMSEK